MVSIVTFSLQYVPETLCLFEQIVLKLFSRVLFLSPNLCVPCLLSLSHTVKPILPGLLNIIYASCQLVIPELLVPVYLKNYSLVIKVWVSRLYAQFTRKLLSLTLCIVEGFIPKKCDYFTPFLPSVQASFVKFLYRMERRVSAQRVYDYPLKCLSNNDLRRISYHLSQYIPWFGASKTGWEVWEFFCMIPLFHTRISPGQSALFTNSWKRFDHQSLALSLVVKSLYYAA